MGQNSTDKTWPEDLTLLYCGGGSGTNLSNSKILNFDRKTEERLLRSEWYCILYTDVHLDILCIRNSWFPNINGFTEKFLARNPVSLCRMCECEYNFPNNRVHTGGNTQQQEFEYQAALTKYGGGTAKYYL